MELNAKGIAAGLDRSCPGCGAANKASAKFCRQCGAGLSVDSPLRQPSETAADHGQTQSEPPASPDSSKGNWTRDIDLRGETPELVGDRAPASTTGTQKATGPPARSVSLVVALGIAAIVIIAVVGLMLFRKSRDEGEQRAQTVTTRSGSLVAGQGNLRIEVNVPARATLDGWHLPDGGAQAASVLVFSNVEATTHTLEVWSEGYRRESTRVPVKADQTSQISVNLQRGY